MSRLGTRSTRAIATGSRRVQQKTRRSVNRIRGSVARTQTKAKILIQLLRASVSAGSTPRVSRLTRGRI